MSPGTVQLRQRVHPVPVPVSVAVPMSPVLVPMWVRYHPAHGEEEEADGQSRLGLREHRRRRALFIAADI